MNNTNEENLEMTSEQREGLLESLKTRFAKNMNRHTGLEWSEVENRLEAAPEKLAALFNMENTGGEPDVVGQDQETGAYVFFDCSAESPAGRRNLCYDRAALDARKEFKPGNTALDTASAMGIEILSEEQYRDLQKMGKFDTKTSSWLLTPLDFAGTAAPSSATAVTTTSSSFKITNSFLSQI